MSCPHLKYSIINKSNGGSVIASSAYNRREKMFDEAENKMKYSHTRADDHVLTKMLLPKNSPESYTDPYRIWNDLNKIESDKIGYKLIIPFQRELSFNQNLELAIELLNDEYVSKGHPVQIDVHRGKNNNYHLHAIAADRRLINGEWENQKTETVYYKRGTVKKLDSRGKVINPDAVKLTNADKVNTPKLKGKKLQYDINNNVIMEKGWQELQYDSNGKPLLDENGYPILVDIREPYYIQEEGSTEYSTKEIKYSKNGKYLKPQFKKDTQKHSDVSDIGNINRIRMTWERLQNEYYKKYNVRDENGKIFTVDLRSYKEQNKVRPADQQMIPTRHIGYGMKSESILNYNDDAKKHNELVKEIQMKARALKAEQDKLARTEKARAAMLQENEKFYALLNPRQAFINSWTSRYNELVSQRNSFETTVLQKLEAGQKFNADHRKQIDRKTRRGNASWNRLERHSQLMSKVSADIQSVTGSTFDIATLAGKKFDALSNKEIVAFVRVRYGYEVSTIAADVLERNHKDNSNAISGRKDKPPYYPKADTNEIKLQQSVNAITGKQDLAAVTATALSTWDKVQDEAPPKNVMNVLDSYYTAEQFYNTNLSGHEWNVVHLDPSYNPDAINRDYNAELKAIDVQEKEEAEARKTAEEKRKAEETRKEAERLAKEQAEADRRAAEEKRKAEETRKEAERLAKEQAEADRRAAEEKRKAEEAGKEAERLAKEQAEADQPAAWSREEYDRLSSIAKIDLEAYREAVIKHLSDSEYTAKLNNYNDYKELRDPVDAAYQKWQAIKKEEEEEARRKTEESYFYNYEPNQDRIDYYELRYKQEERIFDVKFKKQFPDFPDGQVPEEPDQADIEHTIRQKYGKRQANLLIKDTANLKFENKEVLLENYKNSAAARNAYWKLKPTDDDPGTGKPAAAKTSTVAPPDHKKGNGHEL